MAPKNPRTIITSGNGAIQDLVLRGRLILRLMADPRISAWLKLIPVGAALYVLIPDLLIGPIDDALALWLGTVVFLELCPQPIVQEHMDALLMPGSQPAAVKTTPQDYIDADFRDAEESDPEGDPPA